MIRGPTFGSRGKVLLPFEDNPSSKIGVRFDKPVADGVDFAGLCDNGHGYFCNGNFYCPNGVNITQETEFCYILLYFLHFL